MKSVRNLNKPSIYLDKDTDIKLNQIDNTHFQRIHKKWSEFDKPSLNQKLLIPVLTYGPNNQLRGFRLL